MKDLHAFWSAAALALIFGCSASARPFPFPPPPVSGEVALSKPTIYFGNVVVGSDTVVPEKISNTTGSPITVTAASVEGSGFRLNNTAFPIVIPSGSSINLSVTFTPNSTGEVSGTLEISLSGGRTASISVPLSGAAIGAGSLQANPASINFGSGASGQNVAETITNVGGTNATIYSAASSGSGFAVSTPALPVVLKPGQSLTFNVSVPPSTSGTVSGSINIYASIAWQPYGQRGSYRASTQAATRSSLSIPISGTAGAPGKLTASVSTIAFGTVQVGSTQTQSATVTNSGSSPLVMTSSAVSGSGFGVSGLPLPLTLTPGESATFSATFAPQSAGSAQGSISISSNSSNSPLSFQLSGSGGAPGQLALSPGSLNFGNVPVGKTQTLTATVAASGASVTVSSASVSNAEFSLAGIQLPVTIPAGQSASFTVTFAPQSSGTTAASLSFAGNGSSGNIVESLTGAGTAAQPSHSVTLAWQADTSAVSGYNVYRGTQTGGPYSKLNSSPTISTGYADTSVSAGQSYFYVTTAVNSSGQESAHSNEVQATVPTP